jgi:hypothetical protein
MEPQPSPVNIKIFLWAQSSRDHRRDRRPVAEVFYEKEFGKAETISGLVGLIWQVRETFPMSGASRARTVIPEQIRAGVSFGLTYWPAAARH